MTDRLNDLMYNILITYKIINMLTYVLLLKISYCYIILKSYDSLKQGFPLTMFIERMKIVMQYKIGELLI